MPDYAVGALTTLPIADIDWQPGVASVRLIAEGAAVARAGHLVYDLDAEEAALDAYLFPFADIEDGMIVAVIEAIRENVELLDDDDVLPDRVKAEARAVLDHYFSRIDAVDLDGQPTEDTMPYNPVLPGLTPVDFRLISFLRQPTLLLDENGQRQLPEGATPGRWIARTATGHTSSEQEAGQWIEAKSHVAAGVLEIDIFEWIGWWTTEKAGFIRAIKDAAPTEIILNIASPGGFVDDALAIMDFLKAYGAEVTVKITGLTASAATIIAMAADPGKLLMSENSLFLAHYARTGVWGVEEDLEQALLGLKAVNGVLVGVYVKRSGVAEAGIRSLLGDEIWQTAEEAVAAGFVDEVFEPKTPDAVAYMPTACNHAACQLPTLPAAFALGTSTPAPPEAPVAPAVEPTPAAPETPLTAKEIAEMIQAALSGQAPPPPLAAALEADEPIDYPALAAELVKGDFGKRVKQDLTRQVKRARGMA